MTSCMRASRALENPPVLITCPSYDSNADTAPSSLAVSSNSKMARSSCMCASEVVPVSGVTPTYVR